MSGAAPPIHDVAHLALRLGRLMLLNGADTAHVQEAVLGFAQRFTFQAHLLVHAEGLLLTLEDDAGFRTKIGQPVAGLTVNMDALVAIGRIRAAAAGISVAEIEAQLDAIEHAPRRYPSWLVVIGVGVTAAALARLFGGGWPVVAVSLLVGIVTQSLRQGLAGRGTNPIAVAGLAAFGGGVTGAVVMKLFPGESPALCLVAAGMILVPGVPLINGVRDTVGNHVGNGIARLLFGTVTVLAIAFGLFLAAGMAGDTLPVGARFPSLPLPQDMLFSALAGAGYALLFNVPPRLAWACCLCALVGHGSRTALVGLGLDLPLASFAGAFVATLLARLVGQFTGAPTVTFAFPGVVAMIPGFYAFQAGIGGLAIMKAGATTPVALLAETTGLAVTAMLVTAGIAIGLCLALAAPFPAYAASRGAP
jgi:uncharacterized membrane protein YjjP (DUF1212 family)